MNKLYTQMSFIFNSFDYLCIIKLNIKLQTIKKWLKKRLLQANWSR